MWIVAIKYLLINCSLVTNSCYKLLENADVCKDRACRDSIFQLLGIMVKKHNHGLGTLIFIIHVCGLGKYFADYRSVI